MSVPVRIALDNVLLVKTSDYTATSGTSISLTSALIAGDSIEVLTFGSFVVPTATATYTQWNYFATGRLSTIV